MRLYRSFRNARDGRPQMGGREKHRGLTGALQGVITERTLMHHAPLPVVQIRAEKNHPESPVPTARHGGCATRPRAC